MLIVELLVEHHTGQVRFQLLKQIPNGYTIIRFPEDGKIDDEEVGRLKLLSRLTDVCLLFGRDGLHDGDGQFIDLVGYAFGKTEILEKSLEEVNAKNASGLGSKIMPVLEVDAVESKWNEIRSDDTLFGAGSTFGILLFKIFRQFRLMPIICVSSILSSAFACYQLVSYRSSKYDETWIFYLAGSLQYLWLVAILLFLNRTIMKSLFKEFNFAMVFLFTGTALLGFTHDDTFHGDVARKFLVSSWFVNVGTFAGVSDALHPSFRKKQVQLLAAVIMMTAILMVFINVAYFNPGALMQPRDWNPLFSWKIGQYTSNTYGLFVGLEWGGALVIWLFYFIYCFYFHPTKLILFQPPVKIKHRKWNDCIIYQAKAQQEKMRLMAPQMDTIDPPCKFFKVKRDIVEDGSKLMRFQGVNSFENINKASRDRSKGVKICTFWERLFTNDGSVFGEVTIMHRSRRADAFSRPFSQGNGLLLELKGHFMDQVLLVNSRDSLIAHTFGERFADAYFRTTKRLKVFLVGAVGISFGAMLTLLHMFSPSFRDVTGHKLWWVPALNGVFGLLVGFHCIGLMNFYIFKHLLRTFETYFQLYLIFAGYGPLLLMYGPFSPRGLTVWSLLMANLCAFVFADALHPGSRQKRSIKILPAAAALTTFVNLICLWFFGSGLEEPLNMDPIVTFQIGGELLVADPFSMAIGKLLLCNVNIIHYFVADFLYPGKCATIRSTFELSRSAAMSSLATGQQLSSVTPSMFGGKSSQYALQEQP